MTKPDSEASLQVHPAYLLLISNLFLFYFIFNEYTTLFFYVHVHATIHKSVLHHIVLALSKCYLS